MMFCVRCRAEESKFDGEATEQEARDTNVEVVIWSMCSYVFLGPCLLYPKLYDSAIPLALKS